MLGYFSRARHMKNSGFSWGKRYILQNRHFQEKCEKSSKKYAKILPKSTQNPPKIDQETKNIDKKSDADLSFAKKAKKVIKNAKKWPKSPPKGAYSKLDGIREASSEGGEASPKGGLRGRLVK